MSVVFVRTVALASRGFSQEEILQNELPRPTGEWRTTNPTRYLAVGCLRSSFDFDDLIERLAAWASECGHGMGQSGALRRADIGASVMARSINRADDVLGRPLCPCAGPRRRRRSFRTHSRAEGWAQHQLGVSLPVRRSAWGPCEEGWDGFPHQMKAIDAR